MYFTNPLWNPSLMRTNGDAEFQKDVNDYLEAACPQQRNHQGEKGKCCQAAVNQEEEPRRTSVRSVHAVNMCLALCQTGKGLHMQETNPSAEPKQQENDCEMNINSSLC